LEEGWRRIGVLEEDWSRIGVGLEGIGGVNKHFIDFPK